ncbi:MAG: transporter [Rothia mucilaginosa]|nr:transporter [Rothia mucilaginosa]
MVGHLVSLKWKYVQASFRRSIWAVIGLVIAAVYAVLALLGLAFGYVAAAFEAPETGPLIALLAGSVLAIGWSVVPIFFSGLDGTLDESRFVLFPIEPATLQKGQFLGGFVGIPGVASVLAVLLGLIAYGSQPLLLIVYLVCVVLGLANLMVWARLANRLGIMLSANPRVANVLMIVAAVLMMSLGFIFGGTATYLSRHWDAMLPFLPWLGVTPFGSAYAVPYWLAAGNVPAALGCLVLTLGYLAGGWWLWGKNLARSMANVGGSAHHASAAEVAAGDLGLFARFPATPRGAVAARTLHSLLKDNRLQLLTVSTVMLYLMMTVGFPLIMSVAGGSVTGEVGFGPDPESANRIINSGVMQLFGFWIYFCTVFTGYYMCFLVSYDNTAFSLHVLSPLRGIDDRIGRLWGYSILVAPIVVVMLLVASAVNGHLELFPIVLMHQLGVFAAAAGMGCVLDTFMSPPVAPPGANPFKNPKNNEGMGKQLLLMLSMVVVMLSALPGGISVIVYVLLTQNLLTLVIGGIVQLMIGAGLLVGGVVWGGRRFDRLSPRMLERVARFKVN